MHFDLTDLRLFAVVEGGQYYHWRFACGHFSASARVKEMEEALGTALLERHRRGMRPTPAGLALVHRSQLVLAQMERLRGDCANMHARGVRRHIRLMSNTTALEEYLPDVLARWLATNPGIDIALEERLSHEIAPVWPRPMPILACWLTWLVPRDWRLTPFASIASWSWYRAAIYWRDGVT